jgi:hypothetical protein
MRAFLPGNCVARIYCKLVKIAKEEDPLCCCCPPEERQPNRLSARFKWHSLLLSLLQSHCSRRRWPGTVTAVTRKQTDNLNYNRSCLAPSLNAMQQQRQQWGRRSFSFLSCESSHHRRGYMGGGPIRSLTNKQTAAANK